MCGGHNGIVIRASYRAVTLLCPFQAETWRQRLTLLRDRVAELTGGEAACMATEIAVAGPLLQGLLDKQVQLPGGDEVYHPPYPGSRKTLPDQARATDLYRRLREAAGLVLGEDAFARVQAGHNIH